jgi:hypothetical protein
MVARIVGVYELYSHKRTYPQIFPKSNPPLLSDGCGQVYGGRCQDCVSASSTAPNKKPISNIPPNQIVGVDFQPAFPSFLNDVKVVFFFVGDEMVSPVARLCPLRPMR